ncbi:MAG: RHS repeat-associated core domain-containing protein [Myxococcota bacterium]
METRTVESGSPVASPTTHHRYQYSNHLGAASFELTQTAEVISYEEYHPYGTSAYRAVNSSVDVSERTYRYTGKERDEETGLGYHGARYYACWLGRWTASDPIGLGDGANRYAYVSGNPISLLDSTGTRAEPGDELLEHLRAEPVTKESFGISEDDEPAPKQRKRAERKYTVDGHDTTGEEALASLREKDAALDASHDKALQYASNLVREGMNNGAQGVGVGFALVGFVFALPVLASLYGTAQVAAGTAITTSFEVDAAVTAFASRGLARAAFVTVLEVGFGVSFRSTGGVGSGAGSPPPSKKTAPTTPTPTPTPAPPTKGSPLAPAAAAPPAPGAAKARPKPRSVLDNNTLSSIGDGDGAAVTFAERNRGRMVINDEIASEFEAKHGADALKRVMEQYGITKVTVDPARTTQLMADLGITSPKRRNDMSVIATAEQYGLRVVSGDTKVISRAVARGLVAPAQIAARTFDNAESLRLGWYEKVRGLFAMWTSTTANPSQYTGSPVR